MGGGPPDRLRHILPNAIGTIIVNATFIGRRRDPRAVHR
jgi:hypothetical protein